MFTAIVLYRLSTSNHNSITSASNRFKLSYIVFLHQTTTIAIILIILMALSYIVFLHQTTTLRCFETSRVYCLISSFYIKPQRGCLCGWIYTIVLYRLSTSNHNTQTVGEAPKIIVLYRLSTSNHNILEDLVEHYRIVLYRLSTSNHNCVLCCIPFGGLSYIVFLHQTTTCLV